MPADFFNVNTVEHGSSRPGTNPGLRSSVSGLPPHGPFFEQGLGLTEDPGILRLVSELFIAAEHNNTCPFVVGTYFVDLNADERIVSHPFDLLSDRGKAIE